MPIPSRRRMFLPRGDVGERLGWGFANIVTENTPAHRGPSSGIVRGRSLAQMAVAWVLRHPEVTSS
ncbi:MAG: hypothetical protein ACOYMV_05605, partial [Verrucomicrobiia bacterium]